MDHYVLVKDCLKGKPAAQKQLYDLFARPMLSVCYRYTKSMTDAEDVLQEGFVKVFLNLHQYKFEGELGGWIRTHERLVAVDLQLTRPGVDLEDEGLSRIQVRQPLVGAADVGDADEHGDEQRAQCKHGDADECSELLGERSIGGFRELV